MKMKAETFTVKSIDDKLDLIKYLLDSVHFDVRKEFQSDDNVRVCREELAEIDRVFDDFSYTFEQCREEEVQQVLGTEVVDEEEIVDRRLEAQFGY